MTVVVIGVLGSGKSTVGTRLARAIGCQFLEGDTPHPRTNIDKMSRSIPLDDDDRGPWLSEIHTRMADASERGMDLVVACSALKQAYRQTLERGLELAWVHLKGAQAFSSTVGAAHGAFHEGEYAREPIQRLGGAVQRDRGRWPRLPPR